jgi:hypothetical protein
VLCVSFDGVDEGGGIRETQWMREQEDQPAGLLSGPYRVGVLPGRGAEFGEGHVDVVGSEDREVGSLQRLEEFAVGSLMRRMQEDAACSDPGELSDQWGHLRMIPVPEHGTKAQ